MAEGFEVYNANGKLQFSSEFLTLALRRSGSVQATSTSGMGVSESSRLIVPSENYPDALIALSGGGGYGAAFNRRLSSGQRSFSSNAPIGTAFNYYIFDRSDVIPPSSFGLEIFNAENKITFSSNQRAMKILSIISGGSYSTGSKQLAYCQAGFSGSLYYSNEEQEFEGWYYDQNFSVFGGSVQNSGTQVTITEIPYSNGRFGPEGQVPSNGFSKNSPFFIIDVTGLPIGGTYF